MSNLVLVIAWAMGLAIVFAFLAWLADKLEKKDAFKREMRLFRGRK